MNLPRRRKKIEIENGVLKHVTNGAIKHGFFVIPEEITEIGRTAFWGCESLEYVQTSVFPAKKITTIGDSAFYGCTSLQSFIIPEGVSKIQDSTFQHCHSLRSITIPDGVTIIGRRAFMDCISLESITLPESLTEIEDTAFYGCYTLKEVKISSKLHERMAENPDLKNMIFAALPYADIKIVKDETFEEFAKKVAEDAQKLVEDKGATPDQIKNDGGRNL